MTILPIKKDTDSNSNADESKSAINPSPAAVLESKSTIISIDNSSTSVPQRKQNSAEKWHDMLTYNDICCSIPRNDYCSCTTRDDPPRDAYKNHSKTILSEISGQVCFGQMMALMGPSGAGKTSLFKTLTLQSFVGECTGSIQLNGRDMTMDLFKQKCAFVSQEDTLWPALTPKEHLLYAARFIFTDCTNAEKEAKADSILETLCLTICADTKASNLSGGQKRLLSLALVMIKSPEVLFLDEPTSGLDAASADVVVKNLKHLAETRHIIIICTIHQPSSEVFSSFSHVSFLAEGKTIYNGLNGDHVISYFDNAGHKMPINSNPAEFLLKCIATDTDNLLHAWKSNSSIEKDLWVDDIDRTAPRLVHGLTQGHQASIGKNYYKIFRDTPIILKRMFRQSMRDPQVYIARAIVFSLVTIFISLVYLKTRRQTNDYAVERAVQLGWLFAVPSLLTVVNVYQSFNEYKIMLHEVRLGFYHPISHVIARCLIEVPFMVLLSLFALSIGGFALGGLNGNAFWSMTMTYTSMLYAFEALAQVCSTIFTDVNLNILLYIVLWFGSFLFSEIWVAKEDVIMAFRPFFYSSPFRLSIRAFAYLDFHGVSFSCGDGPSLLQIGEVDSCIGKYDGDTILDTIGALVFPTFTSNVNPVGCFGMTISIAIAFKFVYALVLSCQASLSAELGKKKNKYRIPSKHTRNFVAIGGMGSLVCLAIISGLIASNNETTDIDRINCITEIHDLDFKLDAFENYGDYFTKDTTLTVAEAGKYVGPDDIREYVQFTFAEYSPYIYSSHFLRADNQFSGYDAQNDVCSFRQMVLVDYALEPQISSKQFRLTILFQMNFDRKKGVIEKLNGFLDAAYLNFFFGELAITDYVREYVCKVMSSDTCSSHISTSDDCEERLADMPILEGDAALDGHSQSCRFLHAVFAEQNEKHCAHISFDPMEDQNGKIKCQQSRGMTPSDIFDESDFDAFRKFQKNVGISPELGYKLNE